MSARRLLTSLRVARRLNRARPFRQSALCLCVVVALITTSYVAARGFSLSGEQVVQRDMGRFDAKLRLDREMRPADAGLPARVVAAAQRAGAHSTAVVLESYDIRPDQAFAATTSYAETDWRTAPFPNRYELRNGRWPARAGEVAVTPALQDATRRSTSVPVLSGTARLRVVGVVGDRFATRARAFLAAPGTWAGFASTRSRRHYSSLSAAVTLLTSGGDPRAIADAVSDRRPGELATRAATMRLAESETWVDRIPVAYSVPSVLLTSLAVLAIFALNAPRIRGTLAILRSIGISGRDALASIMLVGTAHATIGAVAGIALGAGAGALARVVSAELASRPLSAYPALGGHALRVLAVVAATCTLTGGAILVVQRRSSLRMLLAGRRSPRAAARRQAVATIVAAAAVWQIVRLRSATETLTLAATLTVLTTLLTPELVDAALRYTRAGAGARRRLATRQLHANRSRVVVSVALITASLPGFVAVVTLMATARASDVANATPDAAPGQIVLRNTAGIHRPPPPGLVEVVLRAWRPAAAPIQIAYVASSDQVVRVEDDDDGRSIIAVNSAAEAQRLSNGALSDDDRRTLTRGGMLVWDDRQTDAVRLVVADARPDVPLRTTQPIPVADALPPASWRTTAGGLVLRSTAVALGLPVRTRAVVLTGAGPAADKAARDAAIAAGYDPDQVAVHARPPSFDIPLVYWVTAIVLAMTALLVIVAVVRSNAMVMRDRLAGLVVLGAAPRWARDVLRLETAWVVGISVAIGLGVGLLPVLIAVGRIQGLELSVPWPWLTVSGIALAATALVVVSASSRRLQASLR